MPIAADLRFYEIGGVIICRLIKLRTLYKKLILLNRGLLLKISKVLTRIYPEILATIYYMTRYRREELVSGTRYRLKKLSHTT